MVPYAPGHRVYEVLCRDTALRKVCTHQYRVYELQPEVLLNMSNVVKAVCVADLSSVRCRWEQAAAVCAATTFKGEKADHPQHTRWQNNVSKFGFHSLCICSSQSRLKSVDIVNDSILLSTNIGCSVRQMLSGRPSCYLHSLLNTADVEWQTCSLAAALAVTSSFGRASICEECCSSWLST